jgi:hypothetical protein
MAETFLFESHPFEQMCSIQNSKFGSIHSWEGNAMRHGPFFEKLRMSEAAADGEKISKSAQKKAAKAAAREAAKAEKVKAAPPAAAGKGNAQAELDPRVNTLKKIRNSTFLCSFRCTLRIGANSLKRSKEKGSIHTHTSSIPTRQFPTSSPSSNLSILTSN